MAHEKGIPFLPRLRLPPKLSGIIILQPHWKMPWSFQTWGSCWRSRPEPFCMSFIYQHYSPEGSFLIIEVQFFSYSIYDTGNRKTDDKTWSTEGILVRGLSVKSKLISFWTGVPKNFWSPLRTITKPIPFNREKRNKSVVVSQSHRIIYFIGLLQG